MAKRSWKLITFTDKRTTCTGAPDGKFSEKYLKTTKKGMHKAF